MNKTVIIIGAGLGGLFTGAILAKEGFHVTVLEKNATIGGGLQSFHRFGETFDTGMHVIGGMQYGGNIRKICSYLGIIDKVKILDVDRDCADKLYFAEDRSFYEIASGKENFVMKLSSVFPEEACNLKNYVDAVFKIADSVDLFNLRPTDGQLSFFSNSEDFLLPADEFIAKYIKNKKLRSVVAYMNPLYGGRANQTPAYVHAIITSLYINGASRFVDGSCNFAQLLSDVITDNGGRVVTNDGVKWVEVNDRTVDYVLTRNEQRYVADYYISAIHPCSLFKLMNEKSFPKSYRERLESIPNSYSAFSLYIKLKRDSFKYVNHSEYFMTRYEDIWNFDDLSKEWPLGFLFMTPPDSHQSEYASKALVTAPMSFQMVKKWENTYVGKRGDDYLAWKNEKTEMLLSMVEEMHPGFSDCIEAVNSSSPLTIRDYYGVKEGAICGFSKDCHNIALSQVPVVTKIKNLLLTGQNNNLHGFCGVPLTAINTCEALLGLNYVVDKINKCTE